MAGLLEFLQAASNSAASNVSGPVDGLAWLLRKAGIDVGEPVGGSAWMERQGLTRPVKQSGASLAGETAGLLAPIAAAAKAPQIAKGLLQMGENAAAPRTLRPDQGAIVWHGSPHKFDRFDASKIGTGEGAQAYGHGLYLAESDQVARGYADALKGLWTVDGVPRQLLSAADEAIAKAGSKEAAMRKQQAWVRDVAKYDPGSVAAAQKLMDEIAQTSERAYEGGGANLYKVDLPDSAISRMLDWDKPLSQQAPEVQRALAPTLQKSFKPYQAVDGSTRYMATLGNEQKAFRTEQEALDFLSSNLNGGAAYLLSGEGAQTSNLLARQGIPGIRYLDGGSRGAGTGTSNFVVFPGEDSLLTILERNGIPLR